MWCRPAPRSLLAAALAAAGLALAACGGGAGAGGSPEAAELVPGDAAVFVTLDTDFESERWEQVEALLASFPGAADALAELDRVKPALGREVGIALLDLGEATATDVPVLLVTEASDPAKLEAELERSKDDPAWRAVDGWYVVASDEETLEHALAESEAAPLAESESFERALEPLPEDALARVYVDGEAVTAGLEEGSEQGPGGQLQGLLGIGGARPLVALGLALDVQEQGVRLDGVAMADGVPEAQSFEPTLDGLVPGDVLAFATFSDAREAVEGFVDAAAAEQPDFESELARVELALGVGLESDLLPLFEGEHALAVRAGVPIPEVTLVLSPTDPRRALATVDKIVEGIPRLAQAAGDEAPFEASGTTVAGVSVKEVTVPGGGLTIAYALIADRLVVTTSAKAIADLVAPAGTLAGDQLYREATEAAGVPDEVTGLVYADVEDALGLFEAFGSAAGGPAAIDAGQVPVRYLVLYGEGGEAGEQRFTGFVGLR